MRRKRLSAIVIVLLVQVLVTNNAEAESNDIVVPVKEEIVMEPKESIAMPANPRMHKETVTDTYPVPPLPNKPENIHQTDYQIPPPPHTSDGPKTDEVFNDPSHQYKKLDVGFQNDAPAGPENTVIPSPPPPAVFQNKFNRVPYDVPPPPTLGVIASPPPPTDSPRQPDSDVVSTTFSTKPHIPINSNFPTKQDMMHDIVDPSFKGGNVKYPVTSETDPTNMHSGAVSFDDHNLGSDRKVRDEINSDDHPSYNTKTQTNPEKVQRSSSKCSFNFNQRDELMPSSDPLEYPQKMVAAYKGSLAMKVFDKFIDKDGSVFFPHSGSNAPKELPGLQFEKPIQASEGFGIPLNNFAKPAQLINNKNNLNNPGSNPVFSSGVFDDGGINNMFNNIDNHATQNFDKPNPPPFPDSQFQPGRPFHFGFGFASAKGKKNPFGGDPFSEQAFHFRKKRMAGSGQPLGVSEIQQVCAPERKETLVSFTKYGGRCILWQPGKQGIHFVTCRNTTCDFCTDSERTSKCMAENVEMRVWVFCERGPLAEQIVLDTVKIPTYCTCKIYNCFEA